MRAATAAPDKEHQHHHEMPTSGRALTGMAISATLHCLTGCAVGEIAGLAIGTALGLSNPATIVLAIALAFLFGYGLTSLPLLRAGMALSVVIPIALASDTLSIATMEVVDNLVVVAVPGAMDAGLGDLLFWGSLSFALVIAGAVAVPVNRHLIARGKGHAVVHETGIHGGPSPRTVGAVAAMAFVFGATVLVTDAISGEDSMGGEHGKSPATQEEGSGGSGLATTSDGMTLELATRELPAGRRSELRFRVADEDGRAVRSFDVEQAKRMHLIVVRRDTQGFQHLHPRMSADGEWSTPVTLPVAGAYRVFADFERHGRKTVLGADLGSDGRLDWRALPAASRVSATADGYTVRLAGQPARAGAMHDVRFTVSRGGRRVALQRYLGARGHLVALREGDLAYLHTHPAETAERRGSVSFETEYPTAGRYRMFLQFKDGGRVHTVAFTTQVAR